MNNKRFRRQEPTRKFSTCSCGGQSKLVTRRNYPHGQKSSAIKTQGYVCKDCKKETHLIKYSGVKK